MDGRGSMCLLAEQEPAVVLSVVRSEADSRCTGPRREAGSRGCRTQRGAGRTIARRVVVQRGRKGHECVATRSACPVVIMAARIGLRSGGVIISIDPRNRR